MQIHFSVKDSRDTIYPVLLSSPGALLLLPLTPCVHLGADMFFSDYALAQLVGPGMATWPKLDQVEKFPNILQTGTW